MSRHRIVRAMDYNDEYDGYDDVYGHSVDDDSCISPTDAQQWLYDRARGQESLSSFIATHRNIEEEDEDLVEEPHRRDSEDFQMPLLSENDQARLNSCIDEIRTIVGEAVSEARITDTVLKNNFDCTKSLDDILNETTAPSKSSVTNVAIPKASSMAIEKDFCSSSVSQLSNISSGQTFILPDRNRVFCTQSTPKIEQRADETDQKRESFNKLSDFTNFHLQKTNCMDANPGQCNLTEFIQTADTHKKFVIPKLGSSPKFIIPKLGNLSLKSNDESHSPTPHELSLKKIMDLKKIVITEPQPLCPSNIKLETEHSTLDSNKFVIDLSAALHMDTVEISKPCLKVAVEEEPFVPTFIDCELPKYTSAITFPKAVFCEINSAHILTEHLRNTTRNISTFGKVLCRKYRNRKLPNVCHNFISKHTINPYIFEKPSPDDMILKHL